MGNEEVPVDAVRDRRLLFAAELRRLRAEAGDPSFRRMAEKSGCISHATLHEAASGSRFPSWETTREFVKACDQPEGLWLERWTAAKGAPETTPVAAISPKRFLSGRILVSAAVLTVAVVTALVVSAWPGMHDTVASAGISPAAAPAISARVPGDDSTFVADVTVPDGTELKLNQSVVKVWEIENAGSVYWHGRYLQRMDLPAAPTACRTPDRVPVGDTAPGENVMISVSVQAPAAPTRCWIGWKMVDAQGEQFFSSLRPVYVLVNAVR
jgi:hypothetical protein